MVRLCLPTNLESRTAVLVGLLRQAAWGFAAGALGGLVSSAASWLAGSLGLTTGLGVAIAPAWTVAWLCPRIVWGGLWGLYVPVATDPQGDGLRSGLLLGLAPALMQLLVVFPERTPYGTLGLGLGALTPLFVVAISLIWGVVTVGCFRLLKFPAGPAQGNQGRGDD